jgi:hypothetical protein
MDAAAALAANPFGVDADTAAVLTAYGVDPALFRARQAELAAWRRDPAAQTQLDAERVALRPALEAFDRLAAAEGLLSEAVERDG